MTRQNSEKWRGSCEYWEKLVAIYSAKLESDSNSYIYIPLADAQANLGKKNEAIDTLEYGLALLPHSRAAKILLAQLCYGAGKIDKAKKILVEVVDKWPGALAAVSLLCKIYEKEGAYEQAEKISRTVTYYYPDSPFVKEMAAKYEKLNGSAAEPDAPEKQSGQEAPFTDILAKERAAIDTAEKSASSGPNGVGGVKTIGDKKSETLLVLESMLDKISKIRNIENG